MTKSSNGWSRPPYDFSRIDEIVSKSTVAKAGRRAVKKDYLDVLKIFEEKRMTQGDADKYWRQLMDDPSLDKDIRFTLCIHMCF